MTAGSGILHQEMPRGDAHGRMHGFQLWANLPSSLKMTAPRYQDIAARDIPDVTEDDGTACAWSAASSGGSAAPSRAWRPIRGYLDVSVSPGRRRRLAVESHAPCLRLCLRGFRQLSRRLVAPGRPERTGVGVTRRPSSGNRSLVLFDRGDEVVVQAGDEGIRFLLVSGKPIEEPVAWYGPIVMNTQDQLRQAIADLHNGTFIRGQDE